MLRIYLCDDQVDMLERYEALVRKYADSRGISVSIVAFQSGERLLFSYEEHREEPDIIVLDILMGGEDGLETAKKLRREGCRAEIVFLTSSQEHVFGAFDVAPVGYLLKSGLSQQRLEEVLGKAFAAAEGKPAQVFACENGQTKRNIPLCSIYYFEVANRLVTVHYGTSAFSFYSTLEHVEQTLSSAAFVRTHRAYLVHLPYVRSVDSGEVTMTSGDRVPIGVTYAKRVREAMNRYYSRV